MDRVNFVHDSLEEIAVESFKTLSKPGITTFNNASNCFLGSVFPATGPDIDIIYD